MDVETHTDRAMSRLCLWFGVSVPLVFLGAYFGFRKEQLPATLYFLNAYLKEGIR